MAGASVSVRIDDSELRRLIDKTSGRAVRIVADGVHYGIYQEMGTERMPAHPFMRPAVESVRASFVQAWRDVVTIDQAEAVVEKAARDVERLAKGNAPVDTGALRNSIHVVGGDRVP